MRQDTRWLGLRPRLQHTMQLPRKRTQLSSVFIADCSHQLARAEAAEARKPDGKRFAASTEPAFRERRLELVSQYGVHCL